MKVFKLRNKATGAFYKGKGRHSPKGKAFTSKAHIMSSLKQNGYLKKEDYELITYNLVEEKTEDI
jgi:hypothetical protein